MRVELRHETIENKSLTKLSNKKFNTIKSQQETLHHPSLHFYE